MADVDYLPKRHELPRLKDLERQLHDKIFDNPNHPDVPKWERAAADYRRRRMEGEELEVLW